MFHPITSHGHAMTSSVCYIPLFLSSRTVGSDPTVNSVSNSSEFTGDVLKVVNKIMEGSRRCQEELTMMGMISALLLICTILHYAAL